MTKQELIKQLRCSMFAKRDTLEEAYEYAWKVARGTDNEGAVMTAVQVVVNTIANELEKMDREERDLQRVAELLHEHHPAEIARLADLDERYAYRLAHKVFIRVWKMGDWTPESINRNAWGIYSNGTEYINENGDHLSFDSLKEAQAYADKLNEGKISCAD
jgi:hypothetical protein